MVSEASAYPLSELPLNYSTSGTSNGNGHLKPAISLVNGHPDKDVDMDEETPAATNGDTNGKRKARTSTGKSYKEASASESDDDAPLVR